MKKLLCTLLAMILILGSMMTFVSCDSSDEEKDDDAVTTTEAQNKEPEIPNNYTKYDNGKISFAYPSDWTKTEGSTVMLLNPTGAGNNITVAYEAASDVYTKMDVAGFNETLKPVFESAGMTVTNVSVEQLKNGAGTDVTKIAYTAKMSGVSMSQTMFVVAAGQYNYVVTVTITDSDTAIAQNVYNTLYVA